MKDKTKIDVTDNVIDGKNTGDTPTLKQVLALMIILACCAFFFIVISTWEDARVWETEEITLTGDSGVVCSIDQVTMGKYITFDTCYAQIPEEYINSWDLTIVLKPMGEDKGLYIPTYMSDGVENIIVYNQLEGNYDRTSFSANVPADKLSLQDTDYDIILYYNNNDRDMYIDTGRDLTKEGLR